MARRVGDPPAELPRWIGVRPSSCSWVLVGGLTLLGLLDRHLPGIPWDYANAPNIRTYALNREIDLSPTSCRRPPPPRLMPASSESRRRARWRVETSLNSGITTEIPRQYSRKGAVDRKSTRLNSSHLVISY